MKHTIYPPCKVPTRIEESNLLDEVSALNECRDSNGEAFRGGQGRSGREVCEPAVWTLLALLFFGVLTAIVLLTNS